jgi:hypothetical protein
MKLWIQCACAWLHYFVAFGSFFGNCFAEKYTSAELGRDERVRIQIFSLIEQHI